MKTLEELAAVRDRTRVGVDIRTGSAATRFIVGTSMSGINAGAREVLKALVKEIGARSLTGVTVAQDGNLDMPGSEPAIEVIKPGREKAVFTRVKVDDIPRIVTETIDSEVSVG